MRYLVGNWKCHPDSLETAFQIVESIEKGLEQRVLQKVKIILLPPSPFLYPLSQRFKKILWGAQRGFWEQEGPFTGETSPLLLKSVGTRYILIGHSERRALLKPSFTLLRQELFATLEVGLVPIFCFGEKTRRGEWLQRIKDELQKVIPQEPSHKIILAYEPVWAIGKEKPATPEDVQEVVSLVRTLFSGTPILYGGSVLSPQHLSPFLSLGFDGFLVGRASLVPETFLSLVESLAL